MSNGGWLKALSSSEFARISCREYPEWEKDENKEPYFVMMEIVRGKNDSLKIASAFDDIVKGSFYFRDWTKSGLPFVNEGEIYWSGFWFQYLEDAKRFVETYGGTGTWMEGYKEFCEECNRKRDSR